LKYTWGSGTQLFLNSFCIVLMMISFNVFIIWEVVHLCVIVYSVNSCNEIVNIYIILCSLYMSYYKKLNKLTFPCWFYITYTVTNHDLVHAKFYPNFNTSIRTNVLCKTKITIKLDFLFIKMTKNWHKFFIAV